MLEHSEKEKKSFGQPTFLEDVRGPLGFGSVYNNCLLSRVYHTGPRHAEI